MLQMTGSAERFKGLQWINRRGAPIAVVALLVGVAVVVHRASLTHVKTMGVGWSQTERAIGARIQFMSYLDQHPWLVLPYIAVCAGTLIWLQIRGAPRWALRISFAFLTLPIFGYMWICFRAATPRLTSL